uniref:Uncharacterized protein n=1 Tax=Triticum urartu TaxID=4572 RepID=A0A8R7V5E2_TRIUA
TVAALIACFGPCILLWLSWKDLFGSESYVWASICLSDTKPFVLGRPDDYLCIKNRDLNAL